MTGYDKVKLLIEEFIQKNPSKIYRTADIAPVIFEQVDIKKQIVATYVIRYFDQSMSFQKIARGEYQLVDLNEASFESLNDILSETRQKILSLSFTPGKGVSNDMKLMESVILSAKKIEELLDSLAH